MRLAIVALCLTLGLAMLPSPARADLAAGQRFPNLTFSGALSAADRAYLGLTRSGAFTLNDIQAHYVLLEIFSDSCPPCILGAPAVNRLYQLIEANPRLRGKDDEPAVLKMMGVGLYGKAAAMEVWRIKHEVSFPLIPDPKAQVGLALDIPGVPTYVLLDRQGRVVFVHAGAIGSPRQFLRKILSHLEL
jgi:thiol-disulfide isomerase/thioredoxin